MKEIGDKCSVVIPGVTQSRINQFGQVHGTNGRTHTDPEFAKASMFKGVIVQGTLVLAPVLAALRLIYGGDKWDSGGSVETKFTSFTRPGDRVTVDFVLEKVDGPVRTIAYSCVKDDGSVVQAGTAVC